MLLHPFPVGGELTDCGENVTEKEQKLKNEWELMYQSQNGTRKYYCSTKNEDVKRNTKEWEEVYIERKQQNVAESGFSFYLGSVAS